MFAHEPRILRIALLTHSINPRGGVVHTLELARALHAAGHEVIVMAPAAPGQRMFRELPCAVNLIDIEAGDAELAAMVSKRIDAYVAYLSELLRRQQFDVLHAQDGIGANALVTLHEHGLIPAVVRTVHHLDRFDDERVNAWQARGVHRATQVLCVSRVWQNILHCEYGVKASLVDNGVDLQRFTPHRQSGDRAVAQRLGIKPDVPLILSVGGIEERKNTVRLVRAFRRVRRELPSAQLLIAGGASLLKHDAYLREFEAALREGALESGPSCDVVIAGAVPDADMPALFRLADAVAFPSLREGFGLVVLEALASGTPLAVSRIAPFTEFLGDTAVEWTDPYDIESIADSLLRAIATPRFEPPAICTRFTWTASAAQHIAAYRRLTSLH